MLPDGFSPGFLTSNASEFRTSSMKSQEDRTRPSPPEETLEEAIAERGRNLIEQLLLGSGGPLSEDLLTRAVAHFLDQHPLEAREAVRSCLSVPGPVEQIRDRTYDLFSRHLEGSRIRLLPGNQEIAFGILQVSEAERCFLIPDAYSDPHASDRTLLLQFPGWEHPVEERLLYGEKGSWRLTGLGRWYSEAGIKAGHSVLLDLEDSNLPKIRITQESSPNGTIEARDRELADTAFGILSSFGGGDHLLYFVMRRLLALSFYRDSIPPRPLAQVLASDSRFEVRQERGTVALKVPPGQVHKEDPLARDEERYFGRDQRERSNRQTDPVPLTCPHCRRGFTETEPFSVRIENADLWAGQCPHCQKIALKSEA